MLYSLVKPVLFKLDAEWAHQIALQALKLSRPFWPLQQAVYNHPVEVMGMQFPNPIGLAAGLDKNGDFIDALATQGFGFIEIGTLTPKAQPGNDKPRLFRLPEHEAIINRMGFNNKGIDHAIKQVKKRHFNGVLGINIGKNKNTPLDKAIEDYLICFKKAYCYADYITINLSSPNTPGLRDLQHGKHLEDLLAALKQCQQDLQQESGRYTPIVVKIAPDLDDNALKQTCNTILKYSIDGIIATNTTLDKDPVKNHFYGSEQGGLSGAPLRSKANEMIIKIRQNIGSAIPIIAAGGIMSANDARQRLQNGASLVQVYTGFIYHGKALIDQIHQELI